MNVTAAVERAGSENKVFSAESVFSFIENAGESAPSYQIYVALAWLRDEELIQQHGRQGYSITTEQLRTQALARWEQVPLMHRGAVQEGSR